MTPRKAGGKEQDPASLWRHHGIEDVFFQREAQVNFWTILGGIAVGALLTQLSQLVVRVKEGQWYLLLYAFTVLLLVVASWVQNLWGSLIFRIQVQYPYILLWMLNMVSLSVMALEVTVPVIFFIACSAFLLFTLLFQLYLVRTGAWSIFSGDRIRAIRTTLFIYLAILFISLGAVAHLAWRPSFAAEAGWGAFAFLVSAAAIVMHHFSMNQERKELGIP